MNPLSAYKKLLIMTGELRRHSKEFPFALRWVHSMLPGHSPLADELPWITFRAIDWLDSYLDSGMKVFEYGAGGSTLFLAKRAGSVVSVEHDESFYRIVRDELLRRNINNCQLILRQPEPCKGSGGTYASFQSKYKGWCFESYVRTIDDFPDGGFDLVLVDGRARVACINQALKKVKPGGALMLDNSDRPGYARALTILNDLPHIHFPGLTPWNLQVSRTTVWRVTN